MQLHPPSQWTPSPYLLGRGSSGDLLVTLLNSSLVPPKGEQETDLGGPPPPPSSSLLEFPGEVHVSTAWTSLSGVGGRSVK